MKKEELKDLVKRYFHLTEIKEETFADAKLIDGTKVLNDKDSAFAVGDNLFVETEEGEKVQAPSGEHELESGIVVTVDEEGQITGIKRPGEEGEGSLEATEETMSEEPTTMAEDEDEEKLEEDEDEMMEPSEEVVKAIADIVMPEIESMKKEMANCMERVEKAEEKMAKYEEKMDAYTSETPASESKTTAKFSKTTNINKSEGPKYHQRRYEMTLAKLNNLKK